ncbi:MAG: protein kinase [Phycisphaerales bacterium]|nr:protein kinase [Phycisphaerales bacterium]
MDTAQKDQPSAGAQRFSDAVRDRLHANDFAETLRVGILEQNLRARMLGMAATPVRLDRWELRAAIDQGAMGAVFRAFDPLLRCEVAIKLLICPDGADLRERRARMESEAQAMAQLRHANVLRVQNFVPASVDEEGAEVPSFLVMEFVEGTTLLEWQREAPGEWRGIVGKYAQVAAGLAHIHANKLVHRDIKPANILIHGGGQKPVESINVEDVKVTDFGLGKAGEITTQSIMQSGSLLSEEGKSISGTLAYMSPEQRDGDSSLDGRSDLYSVGIVLFEMMCGERPSGGDMPSHIRDGLPSWVDRVYSRLYTRRDRRFANAAEVLQEIESTSVPPHVAVAKAYAAPPPVATRADANVPPIPTRCPKCEARIGRDDNFCIMCGEQVVRHPRRCTNCHGYPAADDRFCIFCGTPLPEAGRV